MVLMSFKTLEESYAGAIWALPAGLNLTNYVTVLRGRFFTYLGNSLMVVSISVAIILLVGSMAAYA
ncbi:hypothetical protein J8J40_34995, partial [Mycobacterium tuberculosis]|nr:hypothetical protein [Mycobacterium tuberculosis]